MTGENNGLYGQNERGIYFDARAFANHLQDMESEGSGYNVPTEMEYRHKMAECVVAEMTANRWERQFLAIYYRADTTAPSLMDLICNLGDASIEAQKKALEELAAVAEEMRKDGYAFPLVQNALTAATPIAYDLIRKRGMEKHDAVKDLRKRTRATKTEEYAIAMIAKYGACDEFDELF